MFTGIPEPMAVSDLRLPRCYMLTGEDDHQGFGTRLNVDDCVTVGFHPSNAFTNGIMAKIANTLELEYGTDIRPFPNGLDPDNN